MCIFNVTFPASPLKQASIDRKLLKEEWKMIKGDNRINI